MSNYGPQAFVKDSFYYIIQGNSGGTGTYCPGLLTPEQFGSEWLPTNCDWKPIGDSISPEYPLVNFACGNGNIKVGYTCALVFNVATNSSEGAAAAGPCVEKLNELLSTYCTPGVNISDLFKFIGIGTGGFAALLLLGCICVVTWKYSKQQTTKRDSAADSAAHSQSHQPLLGGDPSTSEATATSVRIITQNRDSDFNPTVIGDPEL